MKADTHGGSAPRPAVRGIDREGERYWMTSASWSWHVVGSMPDCEGM